MNFDLFFQRFWKFFDLLFHEISIITQNELLCTYLELISTYVNKNVNRNNSENNFIFYNSINILYYNINQWQMWERCTCCKGLIIKDSFDNNTKLIYFNLRYINFNNNNYSNLYIPIIATLKTYYHTFCTRLS